jgi:hypothetical protein
MWVRGLCDKCNHMSGVKVDRAYAAFAHALRRWLRPSSRRLLPRPSDVPAVPIGPGLVARSVLIGMHAINPGLRTSFPQLAMDLVSGREQIGLPVGLRLRAAIPESRGTARWADSLLPGADSLRGLSLPSRDLFLSARMGPHNRRAGISVRDPGVAAADDWSLYADDVTRVDLRMLTRTFPLIPTHQPSPDEWVSLTDDDIAPILVGDVQPW